MAKVCDISFLCSVFEYLVGVDYSTPRELAVFERTVLEAINICKNTDFDSFSVSKLFESMFLISEAEKLIRPVIAQLENDGLIAISKMRDDLTLDDIFIKDILMTPRGINILNNGYYPDNAKKKNIQLYYNPYQDLVTKNVNISENATGYDLGNVETLSNIEFPASQISQYLASIVSTKNKEERQLLPFGTEIDSISPIKDPVIKKYQVKRQLHIKDGFELYIPNDFLSEEVTLKAIEYYLNKDTRTKYGKGNIPNINPDYTFDAFFKLQSLAGLSETEVQRMRIAVFPLKFKGHVIYAPMAYSLKPAYANKQEQLLKAA